MLSYLQYDDPHREILISSVSSDVTMPEFPDAVTLETRYDLGEEIARGGMGVVLRAYDRNLRRDVAVKVLKAGGEERPDLVRRFLQEAQIGGQLQHPGIAPVYEINRLPNGRPFIAMKLVRGKTLAQLLADRSDVSENQSQLLGVLAQVCQAIAFAQTRRVIHRDLKPDNVMVGEFGEVQVMDWGLAKILDQRELEMPSDKDASSTIASCENRTEKKTDSSNVGTNSEDRRTRLGLIMGTPAYMPPEQPLGIYDEKTDVFAIGSILCEILTGSPTGGDLDAAKQRLDDCQSDQELIELAKNCIEAKPASRPVDAGVVAARLSAHLNAIQSRLHDAEIAAARATVKAEEERKLRRRTHWTVAVVATLLVVFTLVGWFIRNTVHKQQSRDRAVGLVNQLLSADIARVPAIVEQIDPSREWADPLLESEFSSAADGSSEKLHLAIALLPRAGKIDYLSGELLDCGLAQLSVLREALSPHQHEITEGLWQIAGNEHHGAAQRFQAAAALAAYDPDDERWQDVAPLVAEYLTSRVSAVYEDNWLALFQPASGQLTDSLADLHADRSRSNNTRERAAVALAGYLRDDPTKLADTILIADELAEFTVLTEVLLPHSSTVRQHLLAAVQAEMPEKPSVQQRDAHWRRQSIAAVTLVHLGYSEEVWPLLKLTPDPSLRSFIIHYLGKLRVDHNTVAARLAVETEVENLKRQIALCEQEELPVRQAAWEKELRAQPADLPVAPSEGLVVHYSLDETSGTQVTHSVGRQPDGIDQGPGQPQWVPGVVGGALRLRGRGAHIDCGQTFQPERTDAFSFGCWFFADPGSTRGVLFGKFDNELRRGFAVNIDPDTNDVICEWSHQYQQSTLIVRGNASEIVGRWHQLFVAYDGSSSARGGKNLSRWKTPAFENCV